jgi:predicted amidohydrolase
MIANTPTEGDHATLAMLTAMAAERKAWILIGSLAVAISNGKIANRCYLIDPGGEVQATYDKIHMFDVDLDDGDNYRESATYEPGTKAVTADLPWGKLGLTICYDVRFAYLYRALAQAGAEFITVPAAFTKVSGEAHWHVLQRARAIETGSYVIAAAQCGTHAEDRKTYGHSLIVDPWGRVLADGGDDVGVITAEIDPAQVAEARRKIPALSHDRQFSFS